MGADQIEGEAAHGRHVLGPVSGAVARQVVLELDIEQPVHALDPPMAANCFADPLDVERCGGDVGAAVEGRAIGMLGASVDLDDRLDGGEARLPRIAALGGDPIGDLRGGVGAGLDTAMAFFDGVVTSSAAGAVRK